MKLSKAQAKVIELAKKDIDTARKYDTYDEYLRNENWLVTEGRYSVEEYKRYFPGGEKFWNAERNGIARTYCNTKTLKKLEEYGLIEIVYDSTGERWGLDEIKVIGY